MIRFKYICILVFVVSLALISCVKEMNEPIGLLSEERINFMAGHASVTLTRAQTTEKISSTTFIGMLGEDSLFLTATEEVLDNVSVTKSGSTTDYPEIFNISAFINNSASPNIPYVNQVISSSDSWKSYTPALYWPNIYDKIHFFASSPNSQNSLFTPEYIIDNDVFKVSFDYVVPSGDSGNDAEIQPDLIYAITPNQTENDAPVQLEFVHILSAIEFKIGDIGDADVSEALIKITDIFPGGRCTITYPVTKVDENVKWDVDESLGSFTQIIDENKIFKLMPQNLEETDAAFNISLQVGDILHEFTGNKFSKITQKWEANKKYIYTITKQDEVKVKVTDSYSETQMWNVKIQNTGFTTSYIRAAVIGYWYVMNEGIEEVVAPWEISDTQTGILTKPDDWSTYWKEIDGMYYHIQPVVPGEYTNPLFVNYELVKTTGPVTDSQLKISLVTQAVEKDKVSDAWPEFSNN